MTDNSGLKKWLMYLPKRRREREDDICPRCGMGKNNTHIYECTTDETTDIYETCCLEIEVTVDSK